MCKVGWCFHKIIMGYYLYILFSDYVIHQHYHRKLITTQYTHHTLTIHDLREEISCSVFYTLTYIYVTSRLSIRFRPQKIRSKKEARPHYKYCSVRF